MKTINLKTSKNLLSRDEMKEIVAGFGNPSLSDEGATILCNNGESEPADNCDNIETACKGKGGAKICSGGGN